MRKIKIIQINTHLEGVTGATAATAAAFRAPPAVAGEPPAAASGLAALPGADLRLDMRRPAAPLRADGGDGARLAPPA